MIRALLAPDARAASTNSFSLMDRNRPRTTRAIDCQNSTDRVQMISVGRAHVADDREVLVLESLLGHGDDGDGGDDQEQVGDPHQQLVDPSAEVAGQRADGRADHAWRRWRPCRPIVIEMWAAYMMRVSLVTAQLIGAEPVLRRRPPVLGQVLRVERVGGE